ncbi:MAG: hypothetical protein O2954_19345, partial [bacterium]|nr:hypothetical protein [bacterium]
MPAKYAGSHFFTPEQIANAQGNIGRFSWASEERDAAVALARRWIDLSDETLWHLVAEQTIGRSTNASVAKGCPQCGEGINRHGGS